jgi:hypothetical protein
MVLFDFGHTHWFFWEPPACPHLHIHGWRELIEILKDIE